MTETEQLKTWLAEAQAAIDVQPETTWTIAKLRIACPSPEFTHSLVAIDTVTAAGNCNAQAVRAMIDDETGRIRVVATFADFDMRGISHLIGPFQITLQEGKEAVGHFHQRFADALYPLQGSWEVPFTIKAEIGDLIPRPTDDPVVLRSAEPGEYAIPPIGSWFEKWDPISMVRAEDPDGPTLAVIEHAMHVMINTGEGPARPDFYWGDES